MKSIVPYLPAMLCYTIAGILAYNKCEGEGWMLFVGVLLS